MTAPGSPAKPRPWQKRSIKGTVGASTPNQARQRAALKRMDECQLACGLTREQVDAFHAAQRERVRARYGTAGA